MFRIAFVVTTSGTGGMERWLLRVISRLNSVAKIDIYVRSESKGDLHKLFERAGATVHYQQLNYINPIKIFRYYCLLRSSRLDSLVDLTGVFSGLSILIAKLLNIPIRVTFHRRSTFAFKNSVLRNIYVNFNIYLIEKFATDILSNSQEALNIFHPYISQIDSRFDVIRNFIEKSDIHPSKSINDVRRELLIPNDAYVITHLGRLDPSKDHQTLLSAFKFVLSKIHNVYCILAGPDTEKLTNSFEYMSFDESNRIKILGNRSDVADIYNASNLFVFTSITEGLPNALIEAILCGLPVVASDIPSIREIIPLRGHDKLVKPKDVVAFSNSILKCINSSIESNDRIYVKEVFELTNPELVFPQLLHRFLRLE